MNPEKRAFICMPGYSALSGGAARGFWRATRAPESQVLLTYNQGSLLANNFNSHWAHALTLAHHGRGPDYFGMIHADVEPQDWWFDLMVEELEAQNLDILGAVIPIKDGRGLTSLAIERPDRDHWRPLCRITMSEVFRLPETFVSEDVGGPLLLNTGLWVCRFDPVWARRCHFEINDRIVFDRVSQQYRAQVEPEDWFFSRLCHEQGLRIGATRKIQVEHRGDHVFPNHKVWGEAWDTAYQDRSLIPVQDDFVFPTDVQGWLLAREGQELASLAAGKWVLEIGAYQGLSTICMARTALGVVTLDTHDGRGTPEPGPNRNILMCNLWRHGVAEKVTVHDRGIDHFDEIDFQFPFDLIFIDGSHDHESVRRDIEGAVRFLAPNGLLVFHDFESEPGVTDSVQALVDQGGEIVSKVHSLAVVRPPITLLQESQHG